MCLAASRKLALSDVQMPIYAHVKEVVDPQGRRAAIEINYMKFLAYNGFYKVCPGCMIIS